MIFERPPFDPEPAPSLLYADVVAVKEPRGTGGHYRTLELSKEYDRPYRNLYMAEVDDSADFKESELDAYHRLLAAASDLLVASEDLLFKLNRTGSTGGCFPMETSVRESLALDDFIGDELASVVAAVAKAKEA